ncbi:MAG: flagellar protein FliS [Deltaproteobacteria bacterium]|nr:flagellar protein FliS [Deltaproteobacteria bacterium]
MLHEHQNVERTPVVQVPQEVDRNELLLALYASAIRNVKQAKSEIDAGEKKAEEILCLGKAYWIIEHFIESLDFKVAPELCADLQSMYHSMMEHMTEAYTTMNSTPLIRVIAALEELHITWREAIAIARGETNVGQA